MKARENRQKVIDQGAHAKPCGLARRLYPQLIRAWARHPERKPPVARRGCNTPWTADLVIARVAWAKGHRAGLRSQDPIFIRALISNEDVKRVPTRHPPLDGLSSVGIRHVTHRRRMTTAGSVAASSNLHRSPLSSPRWGSRRSAPSAKRWSSPCRRSAWRLIRVRSKVLQKAPGSPDHARIWHLSESFLQRSSPATSSKVLGYVQMVVRHCRPAPRDREGDRPWPRDDHRIHR